MVKGECSAYQRNVLLPRMTGFPTRADCETVRAQVLNIIASYPPNCSFYYVCSGCSGHDIATASSGNTGGSANLTGTNQGNPFYTTNPYDAVPDAYDQKKLQNEALGNGETDYTNTRDIPFDNAVAALTYINGRGVANAKPFDKRLGRVGAMGGFSIIRPNRSSNANRYNGQMGTFGLGGGITPENRSQHIRFAQPGTLNEVVERYTEQDSKNLEANYAAGAEQGNAMPMSSGVDVPFGSGVFISEEIANEVESLDNVINLYQNISDAARMEAGEANRNKATAYANQNNTEATKYEDIERFYTTIAIDNSNMARGIRALQRSKQEKTKCEGDCAQAAIQVQKLTGTVFKNLKIDKE
jgi:hypothetical protein